MERPVKNKQSQYKQSLSAQANMIEQEARMVLPGIQTLFGFQLIAVFNQGFKINLLASEQIMHLVALLLVAISAILVVAPAAYHRQAKHQISIHFIELSGKFLAWAMAPLAIGTCLDIYIVTKVILSSMTLSLLITAIIFLLYSWTWFILSRKHANQIKEIEPIKLIDEKV